MRARVAARARLCRQAKLASQLLEPARAWSLDVAPRGRVEIWSVGSVNAVVATSSESIWPSELD